MTGRRGAGTLACALTCALALLAGPPGNPAQTRAQAQTLEQKQAEARRIESELAALKQQGDQIAGEYSQAALELESLEFLAGENRRKLEKAQNDYKQAKEVLGARLKAIYMAGNVDPVEVILEAATFDDMLNRYDFLNHIANQDLSVFNEVKALRREIATRQRDLEDQETRQRLAVNETQQKQAELQASLKAQEDLLASVKEEILQYISSYGITLSDGSTSTSVKINGPFCFPCAGPHSFWNDWHQPRGGGTRLHMGCDIMASMGTPAVACVNGTITLVTEGGNAGKYLRLTMEGSSTFFYYMHMQDITVSQGQRVSAGDLVGHVGDTGNAKGGAPHIHFEVHPDGGDAVNPYPLLKQFDR